MSSVNMRIESNIAIITITNPPVNAINQAVRQGIVEQITKANTDADIKAIIICCDGRTFMTGADIKEFGKPPIEPHLPNVVGVVEKSSKPVIAAIHGHALGGGLEIMLGAHYRIAEHHTKFGMPEVTLGLIPGASGTQRLPRLIGVEAAVDMIVNGKPIDAKQALKIGLVDKLSDGELLQDAIKYAQEVFNDDLALKRLSEQKTDPVSAGYFNNKRDELGKRKRGYAAPQACLNAIEAATNMP